MGEERIIAGEHATSDLLVHFSNGLSRWQEEEQAEAEGQEPNPGPPCGCRVQELNYLGPGTCTSDIGVQPVPFFSLLSSLHPSSLSLCLMIVFHSLWDFPSAPP